jgi:SPP1 gp7 family putative phage head morphogenesis protein
VIEQKREKQLFTLLYDGLFSELIKWGRRLDSKPFNRTIEDSIIQNSSKDVNYAIIDAIRSARIVYSQGKFTGSFNLTLSKALRDAGFQWQNNGYIATSNISPTIIEAINRKLQQSSATINEGLAILSRIDPDHIVSQVSVGFQDIYQNVNAQLEQKIAPHLDLAVQPKLGFFERRTFEKEYINQTKTSIQNFTTDQISVLRKELEELTLKGFRDETIAKILVERLEVSESKARSIARQETSLITSKYTELQYKKVGIFYYKWSSSLDSSVRHIHRMLHGKIFRFDKPPIVNEKGDRKNPGEDFGCRCVAIPVLKMGANIPEY